MVVAEGFIDLAVFACLQHRIGKAGIVGFQSGENSALTLAGVFIKKGSAKTNNVGSVLRLVGGFVCADIENIVVNAVKSNSCSHVFFLLSIISLPQQRACRQQDRNSRSSDLRPR